MRSEFEAETGSDLYIPVNDVLDRISYLLECHGITYSRYGDGKKGTMCKLSEPIIKDYFDTKRSNKDGAKVKLDRFKNENSHKENAAAGGRAPPPGHFVPSDCPPLLVPLMPTEKKNALIIVLSPHIVN